MASESRSTVLIALAANAGIGVAKLFGGLISGSSSMLAEAAHSVADTLNEVFLLTSLREAQRPADPEHPFGYGKAQFFWAFMAAVGIFVAGSVFSIYEGIHTIVEGSESGGVLVPFIVLGVSVLAEGTSLVRAIVQLHGEAKVAGHSTLTHIRMTRDPTVKTVFFEDSAAVTGLVLAALGVGLHELTGNAVYDGGAAIAIGLLLAGVAFVLGRDTGALLIGEGADPDLVVSVWDRLMGQDEVTDVVELLTMYLGPNSVLLAVRLDLRDDLLAGQVEEFAGAMERAIAAEWPAVRQVFLDPTRTDRELAARTRKHVTSLRRTLPADPATEGAVTAG